MTIKKGLPYTIPCFFGSREEFGFVGGFDHHSVLTLRRESVKNAGL
jgi:hypothetical protein